MGKSALLRSATRRVQDEAPMALGLVQVAPDALGTLPELFSRLSEVKRQFLVFIDDLGFAEEDTVGPRFHTAFKPAAQSARSNGVLFCKAQVVNKDEELSLNLAQPTE